MAGDFTYGGDPSKSSRDAVRFLIGDTIEKFAMFKDKEIDWQIGQTPDSRIAGAELLEVKARQLARIGDTRVGDVSRSFSKVAEQMLKVAKDLRKDALKRALPFFGGLSKSGKLTLAQDEDAVQPAFSLGMTDDPNAVQLNRDYRRLQDEVGGF